MRQRGPLRLQPEALRVVRTAEVRLREPGNKCWWAPDSSKLVIGTASGAEGALLHPCEAKVWSAMDWSCLCRSLNVNPQPTKEDWRFSCAWAPDSANLVAADNNGVQVCTAPTAPAPLLLPQRDGLPPSLPLPLITGLTALRSASPGQK